MGLFTNRADLLWREGELLGKEIFTCPPHPPHKQNIWQCKCFHLLLIFILELLVKKYVIWFCRRSKVVVLRYQYIAQTWPFFKKKNFRFFRNFVSLALDDWIDLSQFWKLYSCEKSILTKIRYSRWEISVSCTIQECDNVTTSYYPVFVQLAVHWSFKGVQKQKKISNL